MTAAVLSALGAALAAPTILSHIPLLRALDITGALLTVCIIRRMRWAHVVLVAIVSGIALDVVIGDPVGVRTAVFIAALPIITLVTPHYRADPRRADSIAIALLMGIASTFSHGLLRGHALADAWPLVLAVAAGNTAAFVCTAWIAFPRVR